MDKHVTFQQVTEDDLEFMRKLRNDNRKLFFKTDIISRDHQVKWFQSLRKNKNTTFYIILFDNVRVGTISCTEKKTERELGNVIIDEPYRRRGILSQVVSIFHKISSKPLVVQVRVDNSVALRVYESLGFIDFGKTVIDGAERVILCKR